MNTAISKTNMTPGGGNGRYMPGRKRRQRGQEEESIMALKGNIFAPPEENYDFLNEANEDSLLKLLLDLIMEALIYCKKLLIE